MERRFLRFVLLLVAGVVIGAVAGLALRLVVLEGGPPSQFARTSKISIGGSFTLLDHRGNEVSDSDFRGSYLLVYFGYTFCPDLCPTTLQDMSLALEALGPAGDKVQPLLITVDPERDTVEVLADYVSLFHPRLVALTGSLEQVAIAARAYGVYYAKVIEEGEDADAYLMDHSTFVYLLGPDGDYLTHFSHGASPEALAEGIGKFFEG
ncbi:MAG: SCO family protein [Alphaproteobacteria bacterium]